MDLPFLDDLIDAFEEEEEVAATRAGEGDHFTEEERVVTGEELRLVAGLNRGELGFGPEDLSTLSGLGEEIAAGRLFLLEAERDVGGATAGGVEEDNDDEEEAAEEDKSAGERGAEGLREDDRERATALELLSWMELEEGGAVSGKVQRN